jgi:cysteinyl-tRNA synthetase
MAHELLGESFDIHGGGLDLQFPHHENEIAQSACAHPHGDFARYWLHNEMLQVEGKKMSKSLGNFFTVRDLLDQGVPGEVIRFVFLMTHYRSPMDWTAEKAAQAKATLVKWRALTKGVDIGKPDKRVVAALADDLNTPGALAILHELSKQQDLSTFAASASLLGLLSNALAEWPRQDELSDEVRARIERLARMWSRYRDDKDWAKADRIRSSLQDVGVRVIQKDPQHWEVRYENPDMNSRNDRLDKVAALALLEAELDG